MTNHMKRTEILESTSVCSNLYLMETLCLYHGSLYRGSLYHGSLYHGSLYHGSLYHGTLYHGSLYHGSLYHGSLYHGSLYHGNLYHGSLFSIITDTLCRAQRILSLKGASFRKVKATCCNPQQEGYSFHSRTAINCQNSNWKCSSNWTSTNSNSVSRAIEPALPLVSLKWGRGN